MFAIVLFSMPDPYSRPRIKEKDKVEKTMPFQKQLGFVPTLHPLLANILSPNPKSLTGGDKADSGIGVRLNPA
jgi:hypothetical protein